MQFCVDVHLLIEPKLLDGCCRISQPIGLNYNIPDRSVVDDVLDSRNQVIS